MSGELHLEPRHVELGPTHPVTHGALRFRLALDGETITDLDVEIGLLHRGFEKECEARPWSQAVPYTDRLNDQSAAIANVGFCLCVEKLLGLATPERGQWLRVLASELARVSDHLTRCATTCFGIQASTAAQYAIDAREAVWDALEALCGARVTSSYVRIGGVRHGLHPEVPERCREAIARVHARLDEIDRVLTRNRLFVDRLEGVGVIGTEECLRHAVTGPILRSTGLALDVRKAEPYLVYASIDFDVPVGSTGDSYDRFLVCMEETRQSLRIVEQCLAALAALGPGPVSAAPRELSVIQPGAQEPDAAPVPAGEAYLPVESANGELGFYLVSDGGTRPVKVRCRPPSFLNLAPLPAMLRGAQLADLGPTFDLLNVVAGECDR